MSAQPKSRSRAKRAADVFAFNLVTHALHNWCQFNVFFRRHVQTCVFFIGLFLRFCCEFCLLWRLDCDISFHPFYSETLTIWTTAFLLWQRHLSATVSVKSSFLFPNPFHQVSFRTCFPSLCLPFHCLHHWATSPGAIFVVATISCLCDFLGYRFFPISYLATCNPPISQTNDFFTIISVFSRTITGRT